MDPHEMNELSGQTDFLWVRLDGAVFRAWMAPISSPRSTGDPMDPVIHFADPEWNVAGRAPVGPAVQFWHRSGEALEELLEQTIARG